MEENVRLLPRLLRDGGDGRNAKCGGAACTWWSDMAREGGKVGRVALPMAAVSLSQYAVQVASNMMVGHLPGVLPLAASAIATSLATVSGFSLLTSLGFIGASLAISLSYWLNVIMLASYIRYSNSCKETRSLPSIEAFKGIGLFLRLALPSALMLCLTTISLMYTIPYGLGAAVSTRVANELGAGNPEGARSAVWVVMCIAVLEATLVTSALLASQHILGYAYSNDKGVVVYVNAIVPFMCVSVAADSIQGVLSGIARGCGWQHLGAYVNLGSFYLVGIPVALFLGFVLKMEGKGLWMGISCGSVVQFLLLSLVTFSSNWQKMSEEARESVFSRVV
ncbi:hypothetical protein PR202_gb02051 [Eleusine coracana subsp. coracana]|uniref:Uncharacterized protein n=1 Tax=Eleusine coracana subsp. coracana TaxID=191504 RepID=A0AAV5DXW9_ELECO|nr:hypothetical protein PR202_gb02051 [Eleusine coracana subsp. coracana]